MAMLSTSTAATPQYAGLLQSILAFGSFTDLPAFSETCANIGGRQNHPDVAFLKLGSQKFAVVSGPTLAELVESGSLSKRSPANNLLRVIFGEEGVFTAETGDEQQEARKLIASFINNPETLKKRSDDVRDLVHAFLRKIDPSKSFDLREVMKDISWRVAALSLFGFDPTDPTYQEGGQKFRESIHTLEGILISIFQSSDPDKKLKKCEGEIKKHQKQLHDFVGWLIEKKRETIGTENESRDILTTMIKRGKFNDEQLRQHAITLFFASYDTTSGVLTNTLYGLSKKPEILQRLLNDLRREPFKEVKMTDPDYPVQAIMEGVRMAAVADFTVRGLKADENMVFAGYMIEKGTTVFCNTYPASRSKKLWGDTADQFDPEHFAGVKPQDPKFTAFQQFFGPESRRRCLGMMFAMNEMRMILSAFASYGDGKGAAFKIEKAVTDRRLVARWLRMLGANLGEGWLVQKLGVTNTPAYPVRARLQVGIF